MGPILRVPGVCPPLLIMFAMPASPPPDPADKLVERSAQGDQEALSQLLSQHSGDIRRHVAMSIGKHWQSVLDEDDVMQVTFIEAFDHAQHLQARTLTGFNAWLRRIADNNLRDAIRALEAEKRPDPRKRAIARNSMSGSASLIEMLGATNTTPSRVMAAEEAESAMDKAIAQLPPDYAFVVRQYDLQGHTVEEVAQSLKKSQGAVYMIRARAHDRLREIMGSPSQFYSQGS